VSEKTLNYQCFHGFQTFTQSKTHRRKSSGQHYVNLPKKFGNAIKSMKNRKKGDILL